MGTAQYQKQDNNTESNADCISGNPKKRSESEKILKKGNSKAKVSYITLTENKKKMELVVGRQPILYLQW
jgi:hypothetical protein